MGDVLRRREPAAGYAPEIHLAHTAMVTGRYANRVHLLCALPRSHIGADLYIFGGIRSLNFIPTVSRDEWLAGVVSRRYGDCVHVQPERRSGDLCLGHDWRASAPDYFRSGGEYIARVESQDRKANGVCERPGWIAGALSRG